MGKKYDYVDWYCDNCDEYMNYQTGFSTSSGEWTCTKCGYDNDVSNDNIIDNSEKLSVWEAADIWRSHGKDEDYMFGYTEDELENA